MAVKTVEYIIIIIIIKTIWEKPIFYCSYSRVPASFPLLCRNRAYMFCVLL